MRTLSVLAVAFAVLGAAQPARAVPIWTNLGSVSGGTTSVQEVMDMEIRIRVSSPDVILAAIFDDLILTEADEGSTFIATSANDPGFDEFAAKITDGVDNMIQFAWQRGGTAMNESGFFGSAGQPDLIGHVITSVEVHIDELTLDVPGRDPNHDGVWTDYRLIMTVTFHGDEGDDMVPEPASLALLGLGALGLLRRRRR